MQKEARILLDKIENLIPKLIPEDWKSIYLYASVESTGKGEMYFYYFPKKLFKSKPINCYEISNYFDVDIHNYNNKLQELYKYIKLLNSYDNPKWTNVTISVEKNIFTIEYNYNDLKNTKYNDEQRRLIWSYKYLNFPLERMSLKDRLMIENYEEKKENTPRIYREKIEEDSMNSLNAVNQILK